MRRHGVLRHADQAGELAGGNAIGFMRHQQAEGLQPGRLGQGGKRRDRRFLIHISRIVDMIEESSVAAWDKEKPRSRGRRG